MAKSKPDVDYALYLVTDSTPSILGDRDLAAVVDAAIQGGVTLVQYRDKHSDTGVLVSTAKKLHAVTKKYGVPLLINDRVDVALAVECEGVHIGQDDLDLATARRLLGDSAIIGVTTGSIKEAIAACQGGADYLGIGTMFSTSTKTNTKDIIGTIGTKQVLEAMAKVGQHVQTVCIGGINASNVQRVLHQTNNTVKSLDGVAVVSAIVAAPDPKLAAQELKDIIVKNLRTKSFMDDIPDSLTFPPQKLEDVQNLIDNVHNTTPLSHNMTNLVVQNIAANVALAVGASPIMANDGREASDLSRLGGGLVVNMGSVTEESIRNYLMAMQAYNQAGQPIVFDPVGGGATAVRKGAVKTLMAGGYFTVIKGNEGEIKTVMGIEGVQQQGVDSGASTLSDKQKASMVKTLAIRERNVIVMTGSTDFVSDGEHTLAVKNGHSLLGQITGSGCVLGTIMSAYLAANKGKYRPILSVIAAILHYEIAAEIAAAREDVQGPGTFASALIDSLYAIRSNIDGLKHGQYAVSVEALDVD